MLPEFLLPETTIREAGFGPAIPIRDEQGETLILTLGITRIVEQEAIEIGIWGSADGEDWGIRPLASFPQKFYCGTYQIQIDLTRRPDVRYLRAQWSVNRWARQNSKPLFTVYLFVQATDGQLTAAGV